MYSGVDEPSCTFREQGEPGAKLASSALAEQIITPGATISGLILPSEVGPLEELSYTKPIGEEE